MQGEGEVYAPSLPSLALLHPHQLLRNPLVDALMYLLSSILSIAASIRPWEAGSAKSRLRK
jgi:hypothetical protein